MNRRFFVILTFGSLFLVYHRFQRGFWLDFVDENCEAGGGAVYNLGPMNFAELVNGGGLWRWGDTSLRISGKAEELAADRTDVVGMSGNLVVWRDADRKTAFSAWMRSTVVPL